MARKSGTGATGRGPRGSAGRQASAPKDKAAGAVQSLTRGLQLLQRLGEAEGGVMLTDLAQTVGLPNSTLLGAVRRQNSAHIRSTGVNGAASTTVGLRA